MNVFVGLLEGFSAFWREVLLENHLKSLKSNFLSIIWHKTRVNWHKTIPLHKTFRFQFLNVGNSGKLSVGKIFRLKYIFKWKISVRCGYLCDKVGIFQKNKEKLIKRYIKEEKNFYIKNHLIFFILKFFCDFRRRQFFFENSIKKFIGFQLKKTFKKPKKKLINITS